MFSSEATWRAASDLKLRVVEPPDALEPLPAAGAAADLEPEEDRDARGRDAHVHVVADALAERHPHPPAPEDHAELVDLRRCEIDLRDHIGVRGDLTPPLERLAGGVRLGGDEDERLRASRGQRPHEGEDVGAVLRVDRRPGRRRIGAEELVQRHPRRRAARRRHRAVEDAVRLVLDLRGVLPPRRTADAVVQIEVEVDGVRPGRPQLGREEQVRGRRNDTGLGEPVPEGNGAVGEVDPLGARRRDPARIGRTRRGNHGEGCDEHRSEDEKTPHVATF